MRCRPSLDERTERGASAVEFALVVVILLTVVFGIVNFGFVFAQQISLNNGARQAARYAVVDGRTCAQIETQGKSNAETIGMDTSEVPTPYIGVGLGHLTRTLAIAKRCPPGVEPVFVTLSQGARLLVRG